MKSKVACIGLVLVAMLAGNSAAKAQQSAPQNLTLRDAISLALKQNLSVRVASAQLEQSEATRQRRQSTLLPHVGADAFINRQNLDLAALGISSPAIPMVVGPFSHYDMRVSASQTVIDRRAYHSWKASDDQEQAAQLDYQDARDLVIRQAAGLYLDAQANAAEVEAAESRVTSSETLEKLAHDQHAQGLATGVDEVRAQVQLARDQQNLLVARDGYQTSLLVLAHYLGLRPGSPLIIAETLKFHDVPPIDVDQAVHASLAARSDYVALLKQRAALGEQLKASRARYLPTLTVNGDYGGIGRGTNTPAGTGEVQGTVTVTLFDRDRNGERAELQAQLKRLDAQIDDLSRQIEEDLRKAALDLDSTANQVTVTESALALAQRELSLAQDRFRNGVTDNIEVVTAQTTLAAAQDDRILALARHADAAMALVRALGGTEKIYPSYLGEP